MTKMSEQVRHLVGLENTLQKARRRHRECERERGSDDPRTQRYVGLIARLSEEIHSADKGQLESALLNLAINCYLEVLIEGLQVIV